MHWICIHENAWIIIFVCRLIELARKMDKADTEPLRRCAVWLQQLNQYAYASECLAKMGDTKSLLQLHIDTGHWEEAFAIAKKQTEYKQQVYVPYARWLAENDKFEEAQQGLLLRWSNCFYMGIGVLSTQYLVPVA